MNTMLPTIRCTGYPLSYAEALNWYKTLYGGRKKWPIFGVMAMGYIAFYAWTLIIFNSRVIEMQMAVAMFLLFCCSITSLLLFAHLLKISKIRQLRPYTVYANDRERHRFGTSIVLYDDRMEITSLRGTIVMRFANVQSCVEAEKGFALTDGRQWIVLRAADMTAELAAKIRERFFITIDRKRIRRVAYVYAQLPYPLPLMNVPTMPSPLVTASVKSVVDVEAGNVSALCAAFAASLGGVVGVMFSTMLSITPWPVLDVVLSVLGVAAMMWFITLSAMRYYRQKVSADPLLVRLYVDGMSVTADGITKFYSKNIVTITAANSGVYMKVLNQQMLFIPFDAVDDARALRQLLGLAENGK